MSKLLSCSKVDSWAVLYCDGLHPVRQLCFFNPPKGTEQALTIRFFRLATNN
jgi:hypothetical protein